MIEPRRFTQSSQREEESAKGLRPFKRGRGESKIKTKTKTKRTRMNTDGHG
jgi:hypothetical protein